MEGDENALSGKYALVTGASSGMGLEYSRQLACKGYSIIMVALDDGDLKEASEEVDSGCRVTPGQKIVPIGMDLGKYGSADELIARVGDLPVEILINNAGIFKFADMDEWPEPKVNMIMAVHMVTPVILCHHYSRLMKERGSGYILNVSSLAAWMPYPGMAMYSATKRFIKSFSRSLRIELLHTGVTVTTAFFGAVDTGLYRLSDRLRKAARRVSVMISAREAASKALDAMFKGRSTVMPGFLNHLAIPIVSTLSERNLNHLDRKYGKKFV